MPQPFVFPTFKLNRPLFAAPSSRAAACVVAGGLGVTATLATQAGAASLPSGYTLLFENDFGGAPGTVTPGGGGSGGGGSSDNHFDTPDEDLHVGNSGISLNLPGGPAGPGGTGTSAGATNVLPPQWDHWRPGIKRRDAINDPRAVVIQDGTLTIKTWTQTTPTGGLEHHSGMIATKGLFEQAYGYYEARIDFNDSPGQWSAFWMYQESIGSQPVPNGANGVELDIIEHRLLDRDGSNIAGKGSSNTHWGGYQEGHKFDYHHTADLGLDEGFHTYGLLWTPDGYKFFIDGNLEWDAPNSPVSHVEQYLLLSSEVENADWAGLIPDGGYGSFEDSQTSMVVDYVRVFGLSAAPVPEPATAGLIGLIGVAALGRRRRA